MKSLSSQYESYCSKIYTFGGMAFILKFFPVTEIVWTGAKFTLEDKKVAIGAITGVTLFLLFGALIALLRDYQVEAQRRDIAVTSQAIPDLPADCWETAGGSFIEKYAHRYFFLQGIGFIFYAITPLIFGSFVAVYNWYDFLAFLNKLFHSS